MVNMSSELRIDKSKRNLYLAFFTAFAVTAYIFEAVIPKPLPFVRIGLANIAILILLADGFNLMAFTVSILKIVIGGFFIGTLFTPISLISLGATIASVLAMILFFKIKTGLSIIGISVIGAVIHNLVQLVVLRSVMIQSDSVFRFIPLLLIIGLISGSITGVIALHLKKRITFGV